MVWLEVASDVLGGLSGVVLLVPTGRVLAARSKIAAKIKTLAAIDPQDVSGVRKRLETLDAMSASFQPADARLFKIGLWTLVASFGLKVIFHALTKL